MKSIITALTQLQLREGITTQQYAALDAAISIITGAAGLATTVEVAEKDTDMAGVGMMTAHLEDGAIKITVGGE